MTWRVSLREAEAADCAGVDEWLGEALNAVLGRSVEPGTATLAALGESHGAERRLRLITLPSGPPVGLIVTAALGPCRSALEVLAIAAAARNLGYGAEAVYALEDVEPATAFLAGVPAENGLAIYFWLRIGYAPVFPKPEDRLLAAERIWMARRDRVAAG